MKNGTSIMDVPFFYFGLNSKKLNFSMREKLSSYI